MVRRTRNLTRRVPRDWSPNRELLMRVPFCARAPRRLHAESSSVAFTRAFRGTPMICRLEVFCKLKMSVKLKNSKRLCFDFFLILT